MYPLLVLFAIVFFELFVLLRLSKDALAIITISQESILALASSEIGDDERETVVRRGSLQIFKATCRFAAKFLSIGLTLYFLFLLTGILSPDLREAMLVALASPIVILTLTAAILCYAWLRNVILSRL